MPSNITLSHAERLTIAATTVRLALARSSAPELSRILLEAADTYNVLPSDISHQFARTYGFSPHAAYARVVDLPDDSNLPDFQRDFPEFAEESYHGE